MNIQYRIEPWDFNRELWASVITKAVEDLGVKDFAAIIGVDVATVNNWSHIEKREGYRWPSMQNFVAVVNALDLYPGDFFILGE